MNELVYSTAARNVLNKFHGVDKIVYVEGNDDITFWELLFDKFSEFKVKIEDSGGKEQLRSRIEEIESGTAKFFVAIDSDFDKIMKIVPHPQILRTFGYSMENTIVSDVALQRFICHVAKVSKHQIPISKCAQWLEELDSTIQPLVLADAVNRIKCFGIPVVGNNCDRFLKSRSSSNLCPQKIAIYLDPLLIDVEGKVRDDILEIMESHGMKWLGKL